jgi:hypothetical protein
MKMHRTDYQEVRIQYVIQMIFACENIDTLYCFQFGYERNIYSLVHWNFTPPNNDDGRIGWDIHHRSMRV